LLLSPQSPNFLQNKFQFDVLYFFLVRTPQISQILIFFLALTCSNLIQVQHIVPVSSWRYILDFGGVFMLCLTKRKFLSFRRCRDDYACLQQLVAMSPQIEMERPQCIYMYIYSSDQSTKHFDSHFFIPS